MTPQNNLERAKVVRSMETLARCINDEDILFGWLMGGVADGDITDETTDEEIIEAGYCEDETFEDLMKCFLRKMKAAGKSGGLYCDGICGKIEKRYTKYNADEFQEKYPDGWGYTGNEIAFYVSDMDECPYIGVKYNNGELWIYGANADRKVSVDEMEWYLGQR